MHSDSSEDENVQTQDPKLKESLGKITTTDQSGSLPEDVGGDRATRMKSGSPVVPMFRALRSRSKDSRGSEDPEGARKGPTSFKESFDAEATAVKERKDSSARAKSRSRSASPTGRLLHLNDPTLPFNMSRGEQRSGGGGGIAVAAGGAYGGWGTTASDTTAAATSAQEGGRGVKSPSSEADSLGLSTSAGKRNSPTSSPFASLSTGEALEECELRSGELEVLRLREAQKQVLQRRETARALRLQEQQDEERRRAVEQAARAVQLQQAREDKERRNAIDIAERAAARGVKEEEGKARQREFDELERERKVEHDRQMKRLEAEATMQRLHREDRAIQRQQEEEDEREDAQQRRNRARRAQEDEDFQQALRREEEGVASDLSDSGSDAEMSVQAFQVRAQVAEEQRNRALAEHQDRLRALTDRDGEVRFPAGRHVPGIEAVDIDSWGEDWWRESENQRLRFLDGAPMPSERGRPFDDKKSAAKESSSDDDDSARGRLGAGGGSEVYGVKGGQVKTATTHTVKTVQPAGTKATATKRIKEEGLGTGGKRVREPLRRNEEREREEEKVNTHQADLDIAFEEYVYSAVVQQSADEAKRRGRRMKTAEELQQRTREQLASSDDIRSVLPFPEPLREDGGEFPRSLSTSHQRQIYRVVKMAHEAIKLERERAILGWEETLDVATRQGTPVPWEVRRNLEKARIPITAFHVVRRTKELARGLEQRSRADEGSENDEEDEGGGGDRHDRRGGRPHEGHCDSRRGGGDRNDRGELESGKEGKGSEGGRKESKRPSNRTSERNSEPVVVVDLTSIVAKQSEMMAGMLEIMNMQMRGGVKEEGGKAPEPVPILTSGARARPRRMWTPPTGDRGFTCADMLAEILPKDKNHRRRSGYEQSRLAVLFPKGYSQDTGDDTDGTPAVVNYLDALDEELASTGREDKDGIAHLLNTKKYCDGATRARMAMCLRLPAIQPFLDWKRGEPKDMSEEEKEFEKRETTQAYAALRLEIANVFHRAPADNPVARTLAKLRNEKLGDIKDGSKEAFVELYNTIFVKALAVPPGSRDMVLAQVDELFVEALTVYDKTGKTELAFEYAEGLTERRFEAMGRGAVTEAELHESVRNKMQRRYSARALAVKRLSK